MSSLHDELPPHYADFPADPITFSVGSENTPPLVNVTEVLAHLRLLAAFNKLKRDVQTAAVADEGESSFDPDRAWVIFVNKAVYRFDKFMSGKLNEAFPSWSEAAIPPLDVIMVWHTYLLNPRTYYEDSIRRTTPFARRLGAMESMPITLLASLVDPITLEPTVPSYHRESFFERTSGLAFLYSVTTTTSDVASLTCPCCNALNSTVPWITPDTPDDSRGKGFAEPHFEHQCEMCSRKFTRSMMGVRRFCEEVTRRRAGRKVYFSETLLDPMSGKEESMLADMLSLRIVRRINATFKLSKECEQDKIIQEAVDLARGLEWSTHELSVQIHQGLRPKKQYNTYDTPLPRVQRIIAAYSNSGYASIDLVAAVLRQGSFIEKMEGLGWLEERRFESSQSQAPLFRAIARYHAFLDLMSAKGASFLVPTLVTRMFLDGKSHYLQDLVWHTHQLSGAAYRTDTLRLLKRTPNHDDTVQPITIQSGYDTTAAAWKERFGVPYSVCGCMPDEAPSKAKPAKVTVKEGKGSTSKFGFFKSRTSVSSRSSLPSRSNSLVVTVKDVGLPRPEIVAEDLAEIDSTHPSEHNLHLERSTSKAGAVSARDGVGAVGMKSVEIQSDFIMRELASKERVLGIKQDLERAEGKEGGDGKENKESRGLPVDHWRRLQAERKESRLNHREAFTVLEKADVVYYPYWGVNAAIPFGFYGAVKYADAVGGCGSGCASCGYSPGQCCG